MSKKADKTRASGKPEAGKPAGEAVSRLEETSASRSADELRARAEAALRRHGTPASAVDAHSDPIRLVHELQVHQIELELQNEQLRRANEELAELHSRYRDLFECAPVAYFTLDLDRRLVELNVAGAELLGVARDRLSGRHLIDFVQEDSRLVFDQVVARALAQGDVVEDALVLRMGDAAGARLHVKAHAHRYQGADAMQVRLVLVDLSALRSAHDELSRALEKFINYWRP